MDRELLNSALDTLRPGLAADGFDLRLGSSTDASGSVEVILEAEPSACLDCLVTDQIMIGILTDAMRSRDGSVQEVTLRRVGFDKVGLHAPVQDASE